MTEGDNRGRAPDSGTTDRGGRARTGLRCSTRAGGQSPVQLSGGSPPGSRAVCPGGAGSGRWVAGRPAGQLGATDTDAFEFPRRKTPHVQVVPVHGGFGVVALELKLKSCLVAAHGFTAHRAGRTHPGSAPHMPSDRRDGSLPLRIASRALSRRIGSSGIVGLQSHGRRCQRTPPRKVALPDQDRASLCGAERHARSVPRAKPVPLRASSFRMVRTWVDPGGTIASLSVTSRDFWIPLRGLAVNLNSPRHRVMT